MVEILSDEEIDFIGKRAQAQIDGTGTPWKGIGPDELLSLVSEVRRLRHHKKSLEGDGFVVVPIEPTENMIRAGWIDKEDVNPDDIYRAMLAAVSSPSTP